MKMIIMTGTIFLALSISAQVRIQVDSLKQKNKSDSLDFRNNNPTVPADSVKWNMRDSIQIDDKNPKRTPKQAREKIR
jgi:hypothetical protein